MEQKKMVLHDFHLIRRGNLKVKDNRPKGFNQTKFNKENTTLLTIRLNKRTDADILAYMSTVQNKQGLLKDLIHEQMARDDFVYSPPIEAPNNDKPLPND